jgi:uncharacterized protein YbaR (Trm112 family)
VDKDALVLEVGAGGNPYPRANVLLDGFESSIERIETELITDRPLVIGLCEQLPFKDKSFDFIIASHVLEHTDRPEAFLAELMRVGKGGYIETPDAFFERINPYMYHRLEVTERGSKLMIRKKPRWNPDAGLVGMYAAKLARDRHFATFLSIRPDAFYTRYYWSDQIDYDIANPEEDASWDYPPEALLRAPQTNSWRGAARTLYLKGVRKLFSQNRRNKNIDLSKLLQCPLCGHVELSSRSSHYMCMQCGQSYPIRDGVPRMVPPGLQGANRARDVA